MTAGAGPSGGVISFNPPCLSRSRQPFFQDLWRHKRVSPWFLLHYLRSTLQAPRFGSSVWGQVRNIRWDRLTPSSHVHEAKETKRVTRSEHQLTHNRLRLFWDVLGLLKNLELLGSVFPQFRMSGAQCLMTSWRPCYNAA